MVHRPCAPEHQSMSTLDIATSLLRGVHVAALVSLFGTLLFAAAALPAGPSAQMRGLLRRLAFGSALAGLIPVSAGSSIRPRRSPARTASR